jgi:hypothetical protein
MPPFGALQRVRYMLPCYFAADENFSGGLYHRRYPINLAWVSLILLLLSLTGCSQAAQAVAAPQFSRQSGDYLINLSITPYPPPILEEVDFNLTITGPQNQPLTNLRPILDLTMPDMLMPPNQLTATPLTAVPGIYRGHTVLTMTGRWQADVYLDSALIGNPIATFEFEAVN